MAQLTVNQGRILNPTVRYLLTTSVFVSIYSCLVSFEELPAVFSMIGLSFLIPPIWSSYVLLKIDSQKLLTTKYYWITGFKIKIFKLELINMKVDKKVMGEKHIAYLHAKSEMDILIVSAPNEKKLNEKLSSIFGDIDTISDQAPYVLTKPTSLSPKKM